MVVRQDNRIYWMVVRQDNGITWMVVRQHNRITWMVVRQDNPPAPPAGGFGRAGRIYRVLVDRDKEIFRVLVFLK